MGHAETTRMASAKDQLSERRETDPAGDGGEADVVDRFLAGERTAAMCLDFQANSPTVPLSGRPRGGSMPGARRLGDRAQQAQTAENQGYAVSAIEPGAATFVRGGARSAGRVPNSG